MKIEGAAAEETSRDAGPVRMMTGRVERSGLQRGKSFQREEWDVSDTSLSECVDELE
jgi:hypothetical protein